MAACSKCGEGCPRSGQRYCNACHAAYMRENRPKHSQMSPEARRKANTRSHTNVLVGRGALTKGPCEKCGATKAQAHHEDYSDPRNVRWMCTDCHRAHHDVVGTWSVDPQTGKRLKKTA